MPDAQPWDTHSVLLSKLRSFDERSAWGLVDEHFRAPLEALARRSGLDGSDVQDVVQETLLTFARKHREHGYDRSKGRLRHWLFGIARHEIANALRRRDKREREQGPGLSQVVSDELQGHWQEEWERHLIHRCLKRVQCEVLPQTYEIFAALALADQRPPEVAARFGVSVTLVYNVKSRVSKRLQELLQELEDE